MKCFTCFKFHWNPSRHLGGATLTRSMERWTDGQTDRVIPIYPQSLGVFRNAYEGHIYTMVYFILLYPSESYFLFADLVGFYTHWTYMYIFRHIFLSNYWWQKSDISSQASYRYPISWEAFFDPSDSRLSWLLYTFNIYMLIFRRIFLSSYWRQKSYIWS